MATLSLLAVLAGCSGDDVGGIRTVTRPNVLVVIVDDLASGSTGAWSDVSPALPTPHMDRLAARGTIFRSALCPSPNCTPSRQAFLTGRWPHSIRVTQVLSILPPDTPTMATVFGQAGYATAAFGKMHWMRRKLLRSAAPGADLDHGLDHGFDLVVDEIEWREQLDPSETQAYEAYRAPIWGRQDREGWSMHNVGRSACPLPEERQLAPFLLERAIAFMSSPRDRPFLTFLSFYEPHAPFTFPERLREVVDADALTLPPVDLAQLEREVPGLAQTVRHQAGTKGELTPEIVRGATASYLSSVAWLDEQLGCLDEFLESSGLRENTIVVFWSDNGYFLGERGLLGKNYPYREAAEVPLAICGPGIPRGSTRQLVQAIDIFPTLCELCGVPAPDYLEGRSLVPTLSSDAPVRDQAYTEFVGLAAALRTSRWKLHLGASASLGLDQLYDLQGDPAETQNLFAIPEHADVVRDLVGRMYDLLKSSPPDAPLRAGWMPNPDHMRAVRWALSQIEEYEVKFR
ncbi:MAG: sulfatase-like hydrolase/transferase [Planctomycetota bacterium]